MLAFHGFVNRNRGSSPPLKNTCISFCTVNCLKSMERLLFYLFGLRSCN
uniref:Uncharacterized protein n=1 Tax=Arundo donax TaxID=35708 RepID=A0A0A9U8Q7_ARUDO